MALVQSSKATAAKGLYAISRPLEVADAVQKGASLPQGENPGTFQADFRCWIWGLAKVKLPALLTGVFE